MCGSNHDTNHPSIPIIRRHHYHGRVRRKKWWVCEKFRKWNEWVAMILIIILLIESFYQFIAICILVSKSNERRKSSSKANNGLVGVEDNDFDQELIQPLPSYSFLSVMLSVEICLVITFIICLFWLKCCRNANEFMVLYCVLNIEIILYGSTLSYAIYLFNDVESNQKEIFETIKMNLKIPKYETTFALFQINHGCCGIRNYKDWKDLLRQTQSNLITDNNSVHRSCCLWTNQTESCGVGKLLIPEKEASNSIYTKGCGPLLLKKYNSMYINYISEGTIVLFLILVAYALLVRIFQQTFFKDAQGNELVDLGRREQENDLELEPIPGKLSENLIADEEATFYAP